ncbi:SMI1/KNR4 family protein [Streptomyces sp. NBC_01171]|uniref:SMI1/KNR4 family protein n=1 Tax=Streptomyces sp. NBC_01171 TaxID=2903757 RepID=UPI0038630972|nr:SMI1/KNR4 family protein [Streptomyces sp. NBC_01171]
MDDQSWVGVRERVEALAAAPVQDGPSPAVFGANGHRFHLDPVLSPADLAHLEARIGVELPPEYRTFLLQVGAGGAGPAYGVFPVRRTDGVWRWAGDGADLADWSRLAEPFPAEPLDPAALKALVGQCPREEDFEDGDGTEDFDAAYEAWDERWEEVMWNPERTVGAIVLCHQGCALRQWLVISGPERGRMWNDDRADDVDLAPLLDEDGRPVTFARWYLDWLGHAERS